MENLILKNITIYSIFYQFVAFLMIVSCNSSKESKLTAKAWCDCIEKYKTKIQSGDKLFERCTNELFKDSVKFKSFYLANHGLTSSLNDTIFFEFIEYRDLKCCRKFFESNHIECNDSVKEIWNKGNRLWREENK